MWNFDKIQHKALLFRRNLRCGLMWNFDKIQQSPVMPVYYIVVV